MLQVIEGTVRVTMGSSGNAALVLSEISLTFEPGLLYAITGPSGSGKTSLVHLLAGILTPSSGSVTEGGTAISGLSEPARDRWRRTHCGLVFQDFRLLDEMGALSNVLLPSWFGRGLRADMRERAEDILDQLGVPLDRGSVGKLSRGEQQRVALARALLADPPIILADEPTASLDDLNAADLVGRLAALREQGKLVICATHDHRLIATADVVIRLENGRLVQSAQELMQ